MKGLKPLLMRVSESSKKMAEQDDKLRERIVKVEDQLRKHISVRIDTALEDGLNSPRLMFCKYDSAWQLVVVRDGHETPLAKASRDVRVRVFTEKRIEKLLHDGLAQMDIMIQMRELALVEADKILEAFEKAGV